MGCSHFHACPGLSYCTAKGPDFSSLVLRCAALRFGNTKVMNPIHAQFRHAPLGMHSSLFISNPSAGHGIKPGPAAAGPSHDERPDRAGYSSHSDACPPPPSTDNFVMVEVRWHSIASAAHWHLCRLTWHPGIMTVGRPSTERACKRSTLWHVPLVALGSVWG